MISFQLTRQELVRRLWVHYFRRGRTVVRLLLIAAVGGLFTFLAPVPVNFVGIAPLVLALIAPLNVWQLLSRAVKDDPELTAPVTIEFDATGMRSIRQNVKTETSWSRFQTFEEDENYFYLSTGKSSFGSVGLIPKRAFSSQSELEQFREFANAGRRLSTTTPPRALV